MRQRKGLRRRCQGTQIQRMILGVFAVASIADGDAGAELQASSVDAEDVLVAVAELRLLEVENGGQLERDRHAPHIRDAAEA